MALFGVLKTSKSFKPFERPPKWRDDPLKNFDKSEFSFLRSHKAKGYYSPQEIAAHAKFVRKPLTERGMGMQYYMRQHGEFKDEIHEHFSNAPYPEGQMVDNVMRIVDEKYSFKMIRRDGTPQILHPYRIMLRLTKEHAPSSTVCFGGTHDLFEDSMGKRPIRKRYRTVHGLYRDLSAINGNTQSHNGLVQQMASYLMYGTLSLTNDAELGVEDVRIKEPKDIYKLKNILFAEAKEAAYREYFSRVFRSLETRRAKKYDSYDNTESLTLFTPEEVRKYNLLDLYFTTVWKELLHYDSDKKAFYIVPYYTLQNIRKILEILSKAYPEAEGVFSPENFMLEARKASLVSRLLLACRANEKVTMRGAKSLSVAEAETLKGVDETYKELLAIARYSQVKAFMGNFEASEKYWGQRISRGTTFPYPIYYHFDYHANDKSPSQKFSEYVGVVRSRPREIMSSEQFTELPYTRSPVIVVMAPSAKYAFKADDYSITVSMPRHILKNSENADPADPQNFYEIDAGKAVDFYNEILSGRPYIAVSTKSLIGGYSGHDHLNVSIIPESGQSFYDLLGSNYADKREGIESFTNFLIEQSKQLINDPFGKFSKIRKE